MRRTRGGVRRPLGAAVVATAAAVLLGACVQIPDDGPVQTAENQVDPQPEVQQRADPRGPQPGASPEETVDGFLEAMLARPMSASVAREFLTGPGASGWRPEEGFLTYDDKSPPGGAEALEVTLTGVDRFDSRGAWLGAPTGGSLALRFPMTTERGEWRIADVEDALVVSSDWFEKNTTPLSLYFFDPEATTLVPEPVFVADGEQMPTMLVSGLLAGPADPSVERSFVPEGLTLSLSVTVTDGVASIPLEGGAGPLSGEAVDRMAAQFAWTLRQVRAVESLRITLDGEPLALSSGDTEFSVSLGSAYDPTGTSAGDELFGLLDGVAVRVDGDRIDALSGPFGARRLGLRDIAVDLGSTQIAAVTADERVLLTSVASGDRVVSVVSGRDLLKPAWDLAGRLWMIDRDGGAAKVWVRPGRGESAVPREVEIPGVTGRDVVDFVVSRDGTRFVAAVRDDDGDRIVAARIRDADAATTQLVDTRVIVRGAGAGQLRVRDLGWRSPTAIFYLRSLGGRQSELRTALVDGSPNEFDPNAFPGVLADANVQVVSSPRPEEPVYLQRVGGGFSGVGPDSSTLETTSRVTALTYVG